MQKCSMLCVELEKISINVFYFSGYKKYTYIFEGLDPEIVFYVFPIESITRLRDKEKGFYAGLC